MNDRQREAVFKEALFLILAVSRKRKRDVLVNRIAYLINYGNAYQSTYVSKILMKKTSCF